MPLLYELQVLLSEGPAPSRVNVIIAWTCALAAYDISLCAGLLPWIMLVIVHGAHSLKTLSVFYWMLGALTDAIRAKTTKWPVPVTAHRRIQKNLKEYVTKGSMYHIALSVYVFPKNYTTNLCLDTPQFDPPICLCTISDVLVSPLRIDYNNIIIQIIINVNAICQL